MTNSLQQFKKSAWSLMPLFTLMMASPIHGATDMSTNLTTPILVFDEYPAQELPKQFRTTQTPFKAGNAKAPTRQGLDSLNASASAQFSNQSLQNAMAQMKPPVTIVDLRKESHMYINGLPISWYGQGNQSNADESDDNIMRLEEMLLRDIRRQKGLLVNEIIDKQSGNIVKTKAMNMTIESAQSEIGLANNLNVGYVRLGVLDHHKPSDTVTDAFVEFVNSLPQGTWLHFHCRGGKGRSTLFMTMYDMLKNGRTVSFDDIVQRQYLIGGVDLININNSAEAEWKKEAAIERKAFLESFYAYATERRGYPKRSYSEWKRNRHKVF